VDDAEGGRIANLGGNDSCAQADGAFLVTACNAHEDLLAACKDARGRCAVTDREVAYEVRGLMLAVRLIRREAQGAGRDSSAKIYRNALVAAERAIQAHLGYTDEQMSQALRSAHLGGAR
jgi:hypothetical protein